MKEAHMGGSGGGSSGKVDYPNYMKAAHQNWLGFDGAGSSDDVVFSVTDTMAAALGNSPYTAMIAYNPDAALAVTDARLTTLAANSFAAIFSGGLGVIIPSGAPFSPTVDFASFITTIKSEVISNLYSTTEVDADIAAFSALLDAQFDSSVLPRFRRGMQDINAVMSSAYVIGAALLEEGRTKEITKYGTALRLQNYKDRNTLVMEAVLKLLQNKVQALTSDADLAYRMAVSDLEFRRAVVGMYHEANRTKIIAKKEEVESNSELSGMDAKWDLEVYQYGSNVLAAIGGGTGISSSGKPSKAASALGGAMSGASIGAVAGPYGAAIGAVIGGIAGYMSA